MSLESNGISFRNGHNTDSECQVVRFLHLAWFILCASENITFMFLCLIHVLGWVMHWIQAIAGTVSRQEKHVDEN
jgi:hypothetical protein